MSLAAAIRAQELTAAEVVEAHIARHERVAPTDQRARRRALRAGPGEAAAADERVRTAGPDEALPAAAAAFRSPSRSRSPLAGMPQSAGLVRPATWRSERSAPPVQRLIDAGAIPLGVTNTSELTLWIESVNRVYGRTRQPV